MRPVLLFLLPFSLLAMTACSGPQRATEGDWNHPFSIAKAAVDGDSLRVTVQYGGGFRDHTFRLVADGAATKSLPRQQRLRIEHEGQGDPGRALITREEAFDLTPHRDPSQVRIVLLLGLEHVHARDVTPP